MSATPCPACGDTAQYGDALSSLCAKCLLETASQLSGAFELPPGSNVGPYDVVSLLGRGGMGQVHLAWDRRLCRTVAIKVLASPFTADVERTRRLEREARIVAGLNHPRICAVYDVGCEGDLTYIVMEHLEGETLAERLTRGPIPIDEVLKIGAEIAEGLDWAHRHEITHRDLKPANIMLTKSGAKLLDFGLAARAYSGGSAGAATASAQYVSGLGGTIQYMAPEQLEGKTADVRSDVFSFGLVLHEMLTAKPAFSSDNAEGLITAVIASDPISSRALRSDVPSALERVIQRCLKKDPDARWQSMRDVLFELTAIVEDLAGLSPAGPQVSGNQLHGRWRLTSAATVVLTTSVVAVMVLPASIIHAGKSSAIRFAATLPTTLVDQAYAGGMAFVSPDGLSLVWVSVGAGRSVLAVQKFDSSQATILNGTDGARWPFWSPDSREIAFFAHGELRKVQASGGFVQMIAKAPYGSGGAWGTRGTILFAPDRVGPLYEVSDRGGDAKLATALDVSHEEVSHQWPAFLPDGRHFIYFSSSNRPERTGLYVAATGSSKPNWIGTADGGSVWAPPHHLLFRRAGMLLAQSWNLAQMRAADEPRVVQQHVCGTVGTIVPPCFSASETGVLVFHVARLYRHQLAWFNRNGHRVDVPIETGSYFSPVLSRDGVRVALERHDPQSWQLGIWQFDLERRILSRIVDGPVPVSSPLWSPDGATVAFASNSEVSHGIYTMKAEGGPPQLLFSSSKHLLLTDWSSDQQQVLFQTPGDGEGNDVWVLPLEGRRPPFPYLQSRFNERQARFSPDRRWVAYSSDESGRFEVYLQPFPATGARWQISNSGGREPTWRRDGRELFYLSGDGHLTAVRMRLTNGFGFGAASELFRIPNDAPADNRISYAPAADGQRFLLNVTAPDHVRLPLFQTEVLVNWQATLPD